MPSTSSSSSDSTITTSSSSSSTSQTSLTTTTSSYSSQSTESSTSRTLSTSSTSSSSDSSLSSTSSTSTSSQSSPSTQTTSTSTESTATTATTLTSSSSSDSSLSTSSATSLTSSSSSTSSSSYDEKDDTVAEWIEAYGPKGSEYSVSWNLLASTASLTDATIPASGSSAVPPAYGAGEVSFFGNFQWLVDANLSGTTDTFLVELEGRHNDGTTATSWGLLASGTYDADEIEVINVENNACNEFRIKTTRTGSTDTLTLACWLLKAFAA